jgi:hypothetical protein
VVTTVARFYRAFRKIGERRCVHAARAISAADGLAAWRRFNSTPYNYLDTQPRLHGGRRRMVAGDSGSSSDPRGCDPRTSRANCASRSPSPSARAIALPLKFKRPPPLRTAPKLPATTPRWSACGDHDSLSSTVGIDRMGGKTRHTKRTTTDLRLRCTLPRGGGRLGLWLSRVRFSRVDSYTGLAGPYRQLPPFSPSFWRG